MPATAPLSQELLQVYESRREAEVSLYRYAKLCKSWGLTPQFRVKAAPMQRGHRQGLWGVWLVRHP